MDSGDNHSASHDPAQPDQHDPTDIPREKRRTKLRGPGYNWKDKIDEATRVEPTGPVDRGGRVKKNSLASDAAPKRTDPQVSIPISGSSRPLPQSELPTSTSPDESMIVKLKFTDREAFATAAQDSTVQQQLGAMTFNKSPIATIRPSRDPEGLESQVHIVERTMHNKRTPTYTVRLPNGRDVNEIKLDDITDHVSVAELERFEHLVFTEQAEAQAAKAEAQATKANLAKQTRDQEAERYRQLTENISSSPLSSLNSSQFDDIQPPQPSQRRFALSPRSKRTQAREAAMSVPDDDVGIFQFGTAPKRYEAAINPNAPQSETNWIRTKSLITARTIETGVDDGENPEFVAYVNLKGEVDVADTGDRTQRFVDEEEVDNSRGTMTARKQKLEMKPVVPASTERRDFMGVSSVVERRQDALVVRVEVQHHPRMNSATVDVVADLYLESKRDVRTLMGKIDSILIDKTVLDSNGQPAWLNHTRGPPRILIDIFDSEGKALPGLRRNAAHLEQSRMLLITEFWFNAEYDTPDFVPDNVFFEALSDLDNGYAFEGTIVVAPNQLKDPENEDNLIGKWKKSGFEVWQEWKEEKTRLVLGRTWPVAEQE